MAGERRSQSTSFRLSGWQVDPAANLLSRDGEETHLEPKVMEVLVSLVRHAGGVASKRDLIDEVWRTEFVAENTLTRAIAQLRRALGDDARSPTFIQTIPKKGYRLLARVVPDGPHSAGSPSVTAESVEEAERPLFVCREAELAALDGQLARALAGQGVVAFVSGEAGTGKTVLIGELCRRAQERIADLVVAVGSCNAVTGAGDPYGPWRQIFGQLTGDLDAGVFAGGLERERASRLWAIAPAAARAVAEVGLDLVETLIPGEALLRRMAGWAPTGHPWLDALHNQAELRATVPAVADIRQSALFEQASRVVRQLAGSRPIALVIEDLHWADAGSTGLLFHLGRRLDGCRVLIVGSLRESEVAIGRGGGHHPMETVLHELQRAQGDTGVELPQSGDREFVEALIDSEPNRLDRGFRDALFEQTGGHALFTVELLRSMKERGELRMEDGAWAEGEDLDWHALPARVEGALAGRIQRLPNELREVMNVAAVEGVEFTAEVAARVVGIAEAEAVRRLGQDLGRRHRLVSGRGLRHVHGRRSSRYGFSHSLFQRYLYDGLDEAERAYLHADVGAAIEALYGDQAGQLAAELARHFEHAGQVDKAAAYLGIAAAGAMAVSAFVEAEELTRHALGLLSAEPATETREAAVIKHLGVLLTSTAARAGWAQRAVREIGEDILERCNRLGDAVGASRARFVLVSHYGNRGDHHGLDPLNRQSIEHAEKAGDPLVVVAAHMAHLYLIWAGEPARAVEHLRAAAASLDDTVAGEFFRLYGYDCRPLLPMWTGMAQVVLGYPDRAAPRLGESIALADALGNPFSRAVVRGILGPFMVWAGIPGGMELSEECISIATERGFDEIRLYGIMGRVFAAAARGDGEPNERYIALIEETEYLQALPVCLMLRAQLRLASGRPDEAAVEIRRALALIEQGGQRLFESSLYRLQGDADLMLGNAADAERAYVRAAGIARRQQTRVFELDAAMALARLWRAVGKAGQVRGMLQPVVEWFTEGLDSKPLVEARELLSGLNP